MSHRRTPTGTKTRGNSGRRGQRERSTAGTDQMVTSDVNDPIDLTAWRLMADDFNIKLPAPSPVNGRLSMLVPGGPMNPENKNRPAAETEPGDLHTKKTKGAGHERPALHPTEPGATYSADHPPVCTCDDDDDCSGFCLVERGRVRA